MSPPNLDALLRDTSFVRRLALAMVRDPDAADDVAQDALVVALERPPRDERSLRGWIASVVRSRAIERARRVESRARHESAAPAPAAVPTPAEIVSRMETSRRVAEAVAALDEPYRTVIYLRYVDELEPRAIAQRLGVPVATIKTRLRRGLALLRERLDRSFGGRSASLSALAPFAASIGTGVLMSTTLKVGISLAAALLIAWIAWPDRGQSAATVSAPIEGTSETTLADPGANAAVRAPLTTTTAPPRVELPENAPYALVLDERRIPVAHARVRLCVRGTSVEETVSDARGRARFASIVDPSERASLFAWDENGRAAATECPKRGRFDAALQGGEPRKLGELVLEPESSASVRVLEQGRAAAGARITLQVGARRKIEIAAVADADGQARFEHLPATAVTAIASAGDGIGRAYAVLAPGRGSQLVVELAPLRTVDVTVVESRTKAPIAGARVSVHELFHFTNDEIGYPLGFDRTEINPLDDKITPTDHEGRTRARIPHSIAANVWASADGFRGQSSSVSTARLGADATEVTVTLSAGNARTARWPLVRGEVEAPPEGTVLVLRSETIPIFGHLAPPPKTARIENGAIVADGAVDGMEFVLAEAPDGALARLWLKSGKEIGEPTSFRRPRRLDVELRDEQDRPAVGVTVELTNPGNNPLAPPATTDEQGRVTFTKLWGWRAVAHAQERELGEVDLDQGDGRIIACITGARTFAMRVRCDGVVRLPARYWVNRGLRLRGEEPERGLLRVSSTPSPGARTITAGISAHGYQNARAVVVIERLTPDTIIDLDLASACSLIANVIPPPVGAVQLRIEHFDAKKESWMTMAPTFDDMNDQRAPTAPDGRFLFADLAPGRYRVRDFDTRRVTEPVDLQTPGSRAEVSLDLSDIVRVRGVVEGPAGFEPWMARIVMEGEGVSPFLPFLQKGSERVQGDRIQPDGSFDVCVPTRPPVTLRVHHDWLSPHPEQGSYVVRAAADGVRLVLVAGDEVRIPLEDWVPDPQRHGLRVHAYKGEPRGEPAHWFHAAVYNGSARFSGLPHGTWTLWIDPQRLAPPVIVRDLVVGPGVTNVSAKPEEGSAIRVRVLHDVGAKTPNVAVCAFRKGEPVLYRITNNDHGYVTLFGLDAGRYAVTVWASQHPVMLLERTIDIDGVKNVDLEVDARGIRN